MLARTLRFYGLLLLPLLFACSRDDGTGPDPEVPVATSLEVTPAAAALAAIGDTVRLEAEVRDQRGAVMTSAAAAWSSLDEAVATVSAAGRVQAEAEGAARIVAAAGSAADTAIITVEQVPASIEVGPDSATLAEGDTLRLAAAVLDANGVAIPDATVGWSSLEEAVATVDSAGRVDALAEGEARIIAAAGAAADTATVTVAPQPNPAPASVEVSPDSASFGALSDSLQLGAVVRDADGNPLQGVAVTWSSADTTVATVSGVGWVVARGNGATVVEAAVGALTDTAVVTVEQVAASVEVSPDSASFDALGDSLQLSAAVRDANGHEIGHAQVAWSSADATVATASGAGWVVAQSNGTTVVEAAVDALTDTAAITVEQIAATVEVSPDSVSIAKGDTVRLTAEVFDANGFLIDGAPLAWSSGDEAIATVDDTGLVAATMLGGVVQITATSGAASGSATVIVLDELLFVSERDGNSEVYLMLADGSRQTNLTNFPAEENDPVWSWDGSRIAFVTDRDVNIDIIVMGADGEGQTNLTDDGTTAADFEPAWSPDGAQIAFRSTRTLAYEIYIMNSDGTGFTNLTNHVAFDGSPAWSPDGTRIAFLTNRDTNFQIYAMNPDGSGPTNLSSSNNTDHEFAWSPDGTRIAFRTFTGNQDVYVMDADGGNPTRLTTSLAFDGDPVWSPDGTRIAFVSARAGNREIYVMNADGSGQTNLTNDIGEDDQPAWSPDGTQIAFRSDRDGNTEIYVMNADGSGQVNITNDPGEDGWAAWRPAPTP